MVISAAGILLLNWMLWGSPFLTGYRRSVAFRNGMAFVTDMHVYLSLETFLSRWTIKLFGAKDGLFQANPILILFPLSLAFGKADKVRSFSFIVVGTVLLYVCLVYSLSVWDLFNNANRYLMTAIVLMAMASVILIEPLTNKYRAKAIEVHSETRT